ncbi:hypothetical protein AAHE18_18G147600 [Arachis hypogaea]
MHNGPFSSPCVRTNLGAYAPPILPPLLRAPARSVSPHSPLSSPLLLPQRSSLSPSSLPQTIITLPPCAARTLIASATNQHHHPSSRTTSPTSPSSLLSLPSAIPTLFSFICRNLVFFTPAPASPRTSLQSPRLTSSLHPQLLESSFPLV